MEELKSLEKKNKTFKKQIRKIEAEIEKRTKSNLSLLDTPQRLIQNDSQKECMFDRIFSNLIQKKDAHIKMCLDSQAMFSSQIEKLKHSITKSAPLSSKRMKLSNCTNSLTNSKDDTTDKKIKDTNHSRLNLNQTKVISSINSQTDSKNKNALNATFVTHSSLEQTKSAANLNVVFEDQFVEMKDADQSRHNLNRTITIVKSKSNIRLNSQVTQTRNETNLNKEKSKAKTKSELNLVKTIAKSRTKSETTLRKSIIKSISKSNLKENKSAQTDSNGSKMNRNSNQIRSSSKIDQNENLSTKSSLPKLKLTSKSSDKDTKMIDSNLVDSQYIKSDMKMDDFQQDVDLQSNTQLNVTNLLVKMPTDTLLLTTPTTKYNLRSSVRSVKKNYVF